MNSKQYDQLEVPGCSCLGLTSKEGAGSNKYSSTFYVWIWTIETGVSMWRELIGPTKEDNSQTMQLGTMILCRQLGMRF